MKEILICTTEDNHKIMALIENGNLLEIYNDKLNENRTEGNIYLGKVQNVLQGMQAAFIDIGEKKNTFVHLKDLLPKVDTTKEIADIKKYNIKDIVKPGSYILIQVKRESTNKKGAKVSTHISIATRFSVFMPNVNFITISQKIDEQKERERLLKLFKENLPKESGAIIRTSAEGKADAQIIQDIKLAVDKWNDIKERVKNADESPRLIYENDKLLKRFLIDVLDQDVDKIIVDDEKTYKEVEEITKQFDCKTEIVFESDKNAPKIIEIKQGWEKLANRKNWLKCGGFITIDKTEALTAIDVNSGKYIGTKSLEQTVFTVNKEASLEIAKQLRLRDIGGIIVIDYIDMQEEQNKKKIIEILEENLKKDRSKTQVLEFTKLNLLEMTRKHMYNKE